MTDPLTHPGQLCTSGDRAIDLALELGQARARLARYEAQEARIRALHVPWYETARGRFGNRVSVSFAEDEIPADHVCGVFEYGDHCEDGEHFLLACNECRTTEDGEPGSLLWPCPTLAALDEPEAPP